MANTGFSALFLLMVAVGTLILNDYQVSAQCGVSIFQLAAECKQYVDISGPKVPPSAACCTLVKALDVPCACKYVTPDVEKLISMDKAVYVGRTCGLTIPSGFHCGSYTVPSFMKI